MAWTATIEVLESRKLLTNYSDVYQIAEATSPHSGPTNLYINFDGGTVPQDPVNNPNGASNTKVVVRPFEQEAGDGSLNREQDIQEVLFEVAEVYAPFNVEVHRIYGAGNYGTGNGDTTVFVGGEEADTSIKGLQFTKYLSSFTPSTSVDAPQVGHTINSEKYDVAFVDPVVGSTTNPAAQLSCQSTERGSTSSEANIFDIARSIAHEAGHTFGLSHVRTDGNTDPTAIVNGSGKVDDIMSYDSTNEYFADQDLTLTSANYNASIGSVYFTNSYPNYTGTNSISIGPFQFQVPATKNFTTQNSYMTLDYTLGGRATDEYANVANPGLVDPIAYSLLGKLGIGPGAAPKLDLSHTSTQYGILSRLGDDHVFTITPSVTPIPGYLTMDHITLRALTGNLAPELLIYNASGTTLVGYADPIDGVASYSLPNGSSYQIVVASQDGNSTGVYEMQIGALSLPINFPPIFPITLISMPSIPNSSSVASDTDVATGIIPVTVSVPTIGMTNVPQSDPDEDWLA